MLGRMLDDAALLAMARDLGRIDGVVDRARAVVDALERSIADASLEAGRSERAES